MARVRKILRHPSNGRNFYLVDACFLANRVIPANLAPQGKELEGDRIRRCQEWWAEIDDQLKHDCARVYMPDICIAEAFKVLAKKYYMEGWFRKPSDLDAARRQLSNVVRTNTRSLQRGSRDVRFHDISTNRDVIVGVDRFFELFMKRKVNPSIPDLIVLATAKYLLEFFDIPRGQLHIVTMDVRLREGAARAADLPNAYDPTLKGHRVPAVFI
jgi:hypothetical protein